jgi:hypothetical protein
MSMPVAGPGALSQRTDKQKMHADRPALRGGRALTQAQQAAPLAATPTPNVIDIAAPRTQRPGEPVTHGADAGPGADSSILRQPGPPATGGACPS